MMDGANNIRRLKEMAKLPKEKKKYFLKKATKRIKPYSDKRIVQNKILSQQVRKMLIERTVCEIKSPVCTYHATCGHHVAGRIGKNLLDKSRNIPACYPCNLYVEENDAWARENGFKVSKFTPVNK
jgi:hypothetical protein